MKCAKIFTIIFLAWGFFSPFTYAYVGVEKHEIFYVDTSYTVDNSDGHVFGVDAFSKIQDAVNTAVAGGVVRIAAGVYDEQVVIADKSLILKGEGDATIIRPSGVDTLTSLYAYLDNAPQFPGMKAVGVVMILDVGSAGVVIQDLRVDGIGVTALPVGAERLSGILYAESGGSIKNVTVNTIRTSGADGRAYGIDINAINNAVTVEVLGNKIGDYFSEVSNGIRAVGGNLTVNIRDNIIAGAENFPPDASSATINGIGLVYGPGGVVRDNVIKHLHSPANGWSSSGIIVYGDNFKPLTVEGNEVFDVDYGISVSNGANDVVIRNNYLHDNKTGVMLESGAQNNKILANTIIKNIQGFQIHGKLSSNSTGNKPPGAGNAAHENLIYENIYGVTSFDDAQEFNATNNWWGDPDPDFAKIIYGAVAYTPWWINKEGSVEIPVVPTALPQTPSAMKQEKSPLPAPVEKSEELQPVDELVPPGGPEGEQVPYGAGGEAIALAEPEESTALFDVEVRPGERQKSNRIALIIITVAAIVGAAASAVVYVLKRKKYA